jgi:hypothetical protein
MLYKDFDINADYNIPTDSSDPIYIPNIRWAQSKYNAYLNQDQNKNRDATNNITPSEILKFFQLHDKCYLCQTKFTLNNSPTLDRIDNSLPHTPMNVEPCCDLCNNIKGDREVDFTRCKTQLRKYCLFNNLPMTIADETTYHILRDGITDGLSNVGHRVNYAGITHINKISYENKNV